MSDECLTASPEHKECCLREAILATKELGRQLTEGEINLFEVMRTRGFKVSRLYYVENQIEILV